MTNFMNLITKNEVAKFEGSAEGEMSRAQRDLNASTLEFSKRPKKGVTFNNVMLRETDKRLRKVVFNLHKLTGIRCDFVELK